MARISNHLQRMHQRMGVVITLTACLLMVLFWRAYRLQVVDGDLHEAKALGQTIRSIVLEPQRGSIVSRDGESLAISVELNSLYAHPYLMTAENKERAYDTLVRLLPNIEDLHERINSNRRFVWIKRRLQPEESERMIEEGALRIDGINFIKEYRRHYPNRDKAGPLLGYINLEEKPQAGLELYFNSALKGEQVRVTGIKASQMALGFADSATQIPEGQTVVTTLDMQVQHLAERALRRGVMEHVAKRGMAVVVKPDTGEILALAQYPTYDPNRFNEYDLSRLHSDPIEFIFEPGSVLKVVTVAAALNERIYKPSDLIYCYNGSYKIGPNKIGDTHPYRWLSVAQVLIRSSNIGAALIAEKLGPQRLYDYLKGFGFGARSGIALPGEVRGLLRQPRRWRPIDLANVGFGQGVSVHIVQLAFMLATIANDGVRMKPMLVKEIRDREGNALRRFEPEIAQEVTTPETARIMRKILEGVVTDRHGTAPRARIEGVSIGGKTGTAQKLDPATKSYSREMWISLFGGFTPIENPNLVVMVMVDEPTGGKYFGGSVAGPVFRELTEGILRTRGVLVAPPEQENEQGRRGRQPRNRRRGGSR